MDFLSRSLSSRNCCSRRAARAPNALLLDVFPATRPLCLFQVPLPPFLSRPRSALDGALPPSLLLCPMHRGLQGVVKGMGRESLEPVTMYLVAGSEQTTVRKPANYIVTGQSYFFKSLV